MSPLAHLEISKIFESWEAPYWDELNWSRVKELAIRDTLEKRKQELVITQNARCVECPNFTRHVSTVYGHHNRHCLMAIVFPMS